MIFVDSGAWFAVWATKDPNHARANQWFRSNQEPLVTTDYVIDETLTLLRARGEPIRAIRLGAKFFDGHIAIMDYTQVDEIREAWSVFQGFADKSWSFTDCTSYVVMRRLEIKTAFAFDSHFRQFGLINVVP